MEPRFKTAKLLGKEYGELYFDTLTYMAFNVFHKLFYELKVKRVPSCIGELLTARGLAY